MRVVNSVAYGVEDPIADFSRDVNRLPRSRRA
jgi:hypothetical protein